MHETIVCLFLGKINRQATDARVIDRKKNDESKQISLRMGLIEDWFVFISMISFSFSNIFKC